MMEQPSLFVEYIGNVVNKMKEGTNIDHLIKAVIEVAQLLSKENVKTQQNNVPTEPEDVGEMSCLRHATCRRRSMKILPQSSYPSKTFP